MLLILRLAIYNTETIQVKIDYFLKILITSLNEWCKPENLGISRGSQIVMLISTRVKVTISRTNGRGVKCKS